MDDAKGNLVHLGKTALPLIGRIGTIVGGIVSLLAVFEKVSGEIVAAVEGTLLITAVVSSGIVVFHRSTEIVDGNPKSLPSYTATHRRIAATVGILAGILLTFFLVRMINLAAAPQPVDRARPPVNRLLTRTPGSPARETESAAATLLPLNPQRTSTVTPPRPTFSPTSRPNATRAPATLGIDQTTDVTVLNGLGLDALTNQNYPQAVIIFSRTLQIQATNAQAQFGIGQAHYLMNNFNAAFNYFRTALELNPNLNTAHAYLGYIYDRRDDYVKARVEYEEFLRVAPKDDPLRSDVQERLRQVYGPTPVPSLTPNKASALSTPVFSPVPTQAMTPAR
jgi:Tfp pilus assembly protein PilF